MKTLIRFLLFAVCIVLFANCQKNDPLMDDLSGKAQLIKDTVSFKVDGFTIFNSVSNDPDACGTYPIQKIVVEGPCNGNQLGILNYQCIFCCNVESGVFWDREGNKGVFIAANGDLLYPYNTNHTPIVRADENDPSYVKEKWDGTGRFMGGTGKFEGATGEFTYHGYNNNLPEEENMSFHSWTGTLILVKGKVED